MKRARTIEKDSDDSTIHARLFKNMRASATGAESQKGLSWLDIIRFFPVRSVEDVDRPVKGFYSQFVHQFFDEVEHVTGFDDLTIQVFYTVDTLDVYIKVEGRINNVPINLSNSTSPDSSTTNTLASTALSDDDALKVVLDYVVSHFSIIAFPARFYTSAEEFKEMLTSPRRHAFKPCGRLVHEFPLSNDVDLQGQMLQVYSCNLDDIRAADGKTREYHARLEWFLFFFFDACSNIVWDKHWQVLILFKTSQRDARVECVGMVSCYTFFGVSQYRRRISQFMIFPPYQGMDIGLRVLEFVHQEAIRDEKIGEITVEQPAEAFLQMRDAVNILIAVQQNIIRVEEVFGLAHPSEDDALHLVERFICKDFYAQLQKKLKETSTQVRRVAIIICLACLLPRGNYGVRQSSSVWELGDPERAGWRETIYSDEEQNGFLCLDACKPLRIAVKRLLRKANIDVLRHLSPVYQRAGLDTLWKQNYQKYYRSVCCVRRILKQRNTTCVP